MKKLILISLINLFTFAVSAQQSSFPKMFAHRGCWTMNTQQEFMVPENSIAAVTLAKQMGYAGIECDVHYTKDKVMVILHDATLNRTMRHAKDYSPLKENIRLSDITFEELRKNYVLASTNPSLRTPIPTLQNLLTECKKQGIIPMLHSDLPESYQMAQEMFGNAWIGFTSNEKVLIDLRKYSDCTILLSIDEGTPEATIDRLKRIGGHCGISTMNYRLLTRDFCHALTEKGYEVQASIFPIPWEATAQKNGITYQLTDYSFMPSKEMKPLYTLNLKKSPSLPSEIVASGAFVLELRLKGEADIVIDGKHTYPIVSDGKEAIYIGRRFFDRPLPVIQWKNKNAQVKRMKVRVY